MRVLKHFHTLNAGLNVQDHLLCDEQVGLLNPLQLLSETSIFCCQGRLSRFLSVASLIYAA